jgi:hypothetical protein
MTVWCVIGKTDCIFIIQSDLGYMPGYNNLISLYLYLKVYIFYKQSIKYP